MKVISGGQTGADKTGLIIARELGIPTGGTAPKGWLTEAGPDYELRDIYGLVEHLSPRYRPRTQKNVKDAAGTVIFGDTSSTGTRETLYACERYSRPFLVNCEPEVIWRWILALNIDVLNVAGNRLSKHPQIGTIVRAALVPALEEVLRARAIS